MAKKTPGLESGSPSFEESLAELEGIVTQLEGGLLGLSEALAAYERGVTRLKTCYNLLQHAERRIELVQSVDEAGRAKTAPLDDAPDDDLAVKTAARSRRRTATSNGPSGRAYDDGGLF